MVRVVIESPYKGKGDEFISKYVDEKYNEEYLQECIQDCFDRNEAPFASHRMYTSALDDNIPWQRMLGIHAGLEWGEAADKIVVYYDRGISSGMKLGIQHHAMQKVIEFRSLYE